MRGQGYDGASNMHGSWKGLQALFLRDCSYAYYIYCFSHRLQLALVAAAEKETFVWLFFSKLNSIVNLISASPKRLDELHSAHAIEIVMMIATGERGTGRGANQMCTVKRVDKTRWGSHFDSSCSVIEMYISVITVLQNIVNDGSSNSIRGEAAGVLIVMRSFDFVFNLHLMQKIIRITDVLCHALQEKSLDILNAIDRVSSTKVLLQKLRTKDFESLYESVVLICSKCDIEVPNMSSYYKSSTGRSCQQKDFITVEHHYRFDIFNAVIDFQVEEINDKFNDENLKLLRLSASLEPRDNFKLFDADQIFMLRDFTQMIFMDKRSII